jgi:hypothetical protein
MNADPTMPKQCVTPCDPTRVGRGAQSTEHMHGCDLSAQSLYERFTVGHQRLQQSLQL